MWLRVYHTGTIDRPVTGPFCSPFRDAFVWPTVRSGSAVRPIRQRLGQADSANEAVELFVSCESASTFVAATRTFYEPAAREATASASATAAIADPPNDQLPMKKAQRNVTTESFQGRITQNVTVLDWSFSLTANAMQCMHDILNEMRMNSQAR